MLDHYAYTKKLYVIFQSGAAEKLLFLYYAYLNDANEKLTVNEDQHKTHDIK